MSGMGCDCLLREMSIFAHYFYLSLTDIKGRRKGYFCASKPLFDRILIGNFLARDFMFIRRMADPKSFLPDFLSPFGLF